jgi:hypothetical protein
MDLADLVRQVPPWALWLEVGLGWMGLLAVIERLRQGRTPVVLAFLGASCLAFGCCGLVLRVLGPSAHSPIEAARAATVETASAGSLP